LLKLYATILVHKYFYRSRPRDQLKRSVVILVSQLFY